MKISKTLFEKVAFPLVNYDDENLRLFFDAGAFNLKEYLTYSFLNNQFLKMNDQESICNFAIILTSIFDCIVTLH